MHSQMSLVYINSFRRVSCRYVNGPFSSIVFITSVVLHYSGTYFPFGKFRFVAYDKLNCFLEKPRSFIHKKFNQLTSCGSRIPRHTAFVDILNKAQVVLTRLSSSSRFAPERIGCMMNSFITIPQPKQIPLLYTVFRKRINIFKKSIFSNFRFKINFLLFSTKKCLLTHSTNDTSWK